MDIKKARIKLPNFGGATVQDNNTRIMIGLGFNIYIYIYIFLPLPRR